MQKGNIWHSGQRTKNKIRKERYSKKSYIDADLIDSIKKQLTSLPLRRREEQKSEWKPNLSYDVNG
jgi:hypothetical protein